MDILATATYSDSSSDGSSISSASSGVASSAFTGRAGVVYLFDSGFAPYASYSESFTPVVGSDSAGNNFRPETGTQYEVGVKFQPKGSRSSVTVAAFDLRRPDAVLVQTFGARGDGAFLISSAMPELVDAARGPIMAALDGRGGGKGDRAQGKCAAIGNISTAVADAQKALAGLAFSGD